MNSTHAKEGQRVLFKGDISKYGSDYQIICDKKISGLLANSQEKAKYYCGSPDYALVIYTKVAPFLKIKTQLPIKSQQKYIHPRYYSKYIKMCYRKEKFVAIQPKVIQFGLFDMGPV